MSQRFGRNQRRRAREEVAALKKSITVMSTIVAAEESVSRTLRHSLDRVNDANRTLASTLQHCYDTLRHGSLALPPPEVRIEKFAKDVRSLPSVLHVDGVASMERPIRLSDMTATAVMEFVTHELSVFTEDTDYDRLHNRVHYRITDRRGFDVAYAVDRATIYNEGERKLIERHIAPAFARVLIDGERR